MGGGGEENHPHGPLSFPGATSYLASSLLLTSLLLTCDSPPALLGPQNTGARELGWRNKNWVYFHQLRLKLGVSFIVKQHVTMLSLVPGTLSPTEVTGVFPGTLTAVADPEISFTSITTSKLWYLPHLLLTLVDVLLKKFALIFW